MNEIELVKPTKEYFLSVDTGKEICMIENNEKGRKIRRYFIETEKRYKRIISNPSNIFDFMRLALDEIEKNTNEIKDISKNGYWQVYYKPKAVKEFCGYWNKSSLK